MSCTKAIICKIFVIKINSCIHYTDDDIRVTCCKIVPYWSHIDVKTRIGLIVKSPEI